MWNIHGGASYPHMRHDPRMVGRDSPYTRGDMQTGFSGMGQQVPYSGGQWGRQQTPTTGGPMQGPAGGGYDALRNALLGMRNG